MGTRFSVIYDICTNHNHTPLYCTNSITSHNQLRSAIISKGLLCMCVNDSIISCRSLLNGRQITVEYAVQRY